MASGKSLLGPGVVCPSLGQGGSSQEPLPHLRAQPSCRGSGGMMGRGSQHPPRGSSMCKA